MHAHVPCQSSMLYAQLSKIRLTQEPVLMTSDKGVLKLSWSRPCVFPPDGVVFHRSRLQHRYRDLGACHTCSWKPKTSAQMHGVEHGICNPRPIEQDACVDRGTPWLIGYLDIVEIWTLVIRTECFWRLYLIHKPTRHLSGDSTSSMQVPTFPWSEWRQPSTFTVSSAYEMRSGHRYS